MKTALKLILGKGVRKSYGQFGEDAVIQAILKNKKAKYVDVGCYDPVLYSNTYALYQQGWSGVVIDPNDSKKSAWRWYRPRDRFVCAGVGENGDKDFYIQDDPAYNSFVVQSKKSKKVKILPLSFFITPDVEFVNIDVEGMDLEVLQSHDWVHKPLLIAVEATLGSESQSYLESKGYTLKGLAGKTLLMKYEAR